MKRKKKISPISQLEAIDVLKLFIEKAELLKSSSLIRTLAEMRELRINEKVRTVEPKTNKTTLDSEQIDAFLLTLRMFVQNTDVISIGNMANLISSLNLSEGPKDVFMKQRDILNDFLNRGCRWSFHGLKFTNRDILNTVLYGYHGHLNPEKYRLYKKLISGPFGIPMVYMEFTDILQDILRMLLVLSYNCRLMVKELEANPPAMGSIQKKGQY